MKPLVVVGIGSIFLTVLFLTGCLSLGEQPGYQPSTPPKEVLVVEVPSSNAAPSDGQPGSGEGQPGDQGQLLPSLSDVAGGSPVSPYADSCLDLDGGMFPTAYGATYRYYKGTVTPYEDSCTGDVLVEHFCVSNYVRTREFTCTGGCSKGACLGGFDSEEALPAEEEAPAEEPPANAKDPAREFYNCNNGFRDTEETGIDCGGPNCPGCGFGKHCEQNRDCAAPLVCNVRMKKCSGFQH